MTDYTPFVICNNCDLCQEIKVPKGIKIKEFDCPNCKCKTLKLIKLTETEYGS